MKDKTYIYVIALGLLVLTYTSVFGQEKSSHLAYKIPTDAIKRGPFSHRGSSEHTYCIYSVKSNNKFGQEIVAREYFTNSKRAKLKLYKNGKRHGIWKEWYPNGALKSQECYNMDIPDGTFKVWNKSGQLTAIYSFVKGVGRQTLYYSNGMLKADRHLKNEATIGNAVTLFDNGQLRSLLWVNKKSRMGLSFGFYDDGSIRHIITIDNEAPYHSSGHYKGMVVHFLNDGSFHKIEYRMGNKDLTKNEYLAERKKMKFLPPAYKDPQKYKEWLTAEMKAVMKKYKNLQPVKIPLEFDDQGNPLSEDGKPVVLPNFTLPDKNL